MSADSTNDADDNVPSGMTLIDTDSGTTDTFSIALYSRIYDLVDPVEQTESTTSAPLSTAPTPRQNNHYAPPSPASNGLPATFESRLREQLQATCRAPPTKPRTPTSSPTSFLDIAEEQLQEHFDRVLTDEALCDGSVFHELTPERLENAFSERYGKGIHEVKEPIRQLVHDALDDYRLYFEAENDILDSAKRYDSLATWLKHTRDLFTNQGVVPTEEQSQELESKLLQYMTNTPEWKKKFTDAQRKWEKLCTTRQALRGIHQLVGGTTGCRICFNKQVKTLLVPCGHVLCEDCANRVTCCPFCNTPFYARQEMFFV